MTSERNDEYWIGIVRELCKLPTETEWVEFKMNNAQPEEIGEYLSALSNSAAFCGKDKAYLLWGVDDKSHEIVGASFSPKQAKKGNEELESWLLRLLSPKIDFRFYELLVDGKPVVLLEIGRAFRHPVQFQGVEYIRVGSYKKKLKEFQEKERELWRIFDQIPFEQMSAMENVEVQRVAQLIDYTSYFDLMELPVPSSLDAVLDTLEADNLVKRTDGGNWNITNLGAMLFAKRLSDFHTLQRKVVRVVVYKGNNRVETEREQEGAKGYAVGFEGLIGFIHAMLPTNEVILTSIRKTVPVYPELAVRELVANALIHQDFFITGAGPMIEIFKDRIEITNPGTPLVDPQRFLDSPPRSRNEKLARLMRRIGICEERGSGIDKVVFEAELHQLPAPVFERAGDDSTRAILFAPRPLTRMEKTDRIRACYLHACLKYVNREFMTNASIRERFGINGSNKSIASRYIREAVDDGAIRPYDEKAPPKLRKYVPFWA